MNDLTDLRLDGVERILIVAAHPDDCDFGCAGTTARWIQAGVEVSYCIVTGGDQGGFDKSMARTDMAQIRRAEQSAAARVVGVTDIAFLGYPDGRLTASVELRRDISRVIRQRRPQRVVCPSPEINYARIHASHPDHLATGRASLAAVYPDARNPFAHPALLAQEGLHEHTVSSTWLMAHPHCDIAVDITESFDTKVAALRCHTSQFIEIDKLEGRLRQWSEHTATTMGLANGRLAEAFLALDTE